MEPSVLAIASRKGGVGKTSVAGVLAGYLVESGPTLLIDTDPQCDVTIAAGVGPADFNEGIYAPYTQSASHSEIMPPAQSGSLRGPDLVGT